MKKTELASPVRRGLLVAGLAASSGLAACASTQPVDERRNMPVPSGKGAIVLRLVTDGVPSPTAEDDEPADFADEVRSAVVIREGTEHRVRLKRVHGGGTQSTVLMGGFAEPGHYHLAWIEDDEEAFLMDPDLVRFEVKPGTVSLLGTLVVEAVDKSGDEWKLTAVGHVPADVEAEKVAIGVLPGVWPMGQAGRVDLPRNAAKLVAAQERARQFKSRLPALPAVEQLASGEFASRGRLGVIYLRPRLRGQATRIDVGSSGELATLQRYRSGLIVGGEEGLIRFSTDEGRRWEQVPAPSAGLIRLLVPLKDDGLAALVRLGHTWSVHVTADPWRTPWRQVAEFSFRELRDVFQPQAFAVAVGDKIGLMHHRGGFAMFDLRTGEVTRPYPKAPPTSALVWARAPSVTSFDATPDGLLVMQGQRAGNVAEASADGGRTWTDLALPLSSVGIVFRDRRVGYAIGQLQGTLVTRDAGVTWTRTGPAPLLDVAQIVRMDIDRVDGALLVQLKNGRVMRSLDEGGSWTGIG